MKKALLSSCLVLIIVFIGIIKAKVIIESGRFGQIINLRGLYGKSGGKRFRHSWRNNAEISGGGILLGQGSYAGSLPPFCGDFDEVKCSTNQRFWKFDVEENAYVILGNPQCQHALCHSSATFWKLIPSRHYA